MSYYVGYMLVCIEDFFVFEKGGKYYCTREDDKYFFLQNRTTHFNVNEFKVSKKLLKYFIMEGIKR